MPANSETITVVRPGQRDRHGDVSTADEHQIVGVIAAPAGSDEDVNRGDRITDRWDLYMPIGSDIKVTDRVRRSTDPDEGESVRSRGPWVVVGVPAPWRSPFTEWAPGMVVRVERSSG